MATKKKKATKKKQGRPARAKGGTVHLGLSVDPKVKKLIDRAVKLYSKRKKPISRSQWAEDLLARAAKREVAR